MQSEQSSSASRRFTLAIYPLKPEIAHGYIAHLGEPRQCLINGVPGNLVLGPPFTRLRQAPFRYERLGVMIVLR